MTNPPAPVSTPSAGRRCAGAPAEPADGRPLTDHEFAAVAQDDWCEDLLATPSVAMPAVPGSPGHRSAAPAPPAVTSTRWPTSRVLCRRTAALVCPSPQPMFFSAACVPPPAPLPTLSWSSGDGTSICEACFGCALPLGAVSRVHVRRLALPSCRQRAISVRLVPPRQLFLTLLPGTCSSSIARLNAAPHAVSLACPGRCGGCSRRGYPRRCGHVYVQVAPGTLITPARPSSPTCPQRCAMLTFRRL